MDIVARVNFLVCLFIHLISPILIYCNLISLSKKLEFFG